MLPYRINNSGSIGVVTALHRFENTAALGSQRLNANGMVSIAELAFFFLRQSTTDAIPDFPTSRVQKRLIHLISQRIEVAFSSGQAKVSMQAPSLAVQPLQLKQTWVQSKSRNQTADILRQELIKRFLSEATGFVAGTRHSSQKDIAGQSKDNSSGLQAASQLITAYFAKASDKLLEKLGAQSFRHLSYYHDASKVSTYDVPCLNVELCLMMFLVWKNFVGIFYSTERLPIALLAGILGQQGSSATCLLRWICGLLPFIPVACAESATRERS